MFKIVSIFMLTVAVSFASTVSNKSVVKIFSSISFPNYKYPWQSGQIINVSGSGLVIKGNLILTSAHVVSSAKFIQVKKEDSSKKYSAKVKFFSKQADLALLEVKDKSFFKDIKPLKFTNQIKRGDSLIVIGYPKGGQSLSTTKGVISRIEIEPYVWSFERMLSIQIDAAVNPGNSGGPALNSKGRVVGVVMQTMRNSSNIAYIVPSSIINTFLKDTMDGRVNGYDDSGNTVERLENKTIKEYYHIKNNKGVVVVELDKKEKNLKLGDIIISIDGKDVFDDATIKTPYGNVGYKFALHLKPVGTLIKMKIIRDKKILEITYKLKRKEKVLYYERNKLPRYIIFGGLVFTPMTNNYITALHIPSMDILFYHNCLTKGIKEAVILHYGKFPLDVNSGYHPSGQIVKSVNGIKVVDFTQFVKLIDSSNKPNTIFNFLDNTKLILPTKEAKESFKRVKKIYNLDTDRRL